MLKTRLSGLVSMIAAKLNSVRDSAVAEFDSVYQTINAVIGAIPDRTSDLINDSGFIESQDNVVKILSVHATQLSSLDEAGLVEFFNNQGFTKDDIDTIIFEIDESDNTGGGGGTFEPETIAFMQDGDVSIANNNTVYYQGTPQERTGAQLWTAVDNFVKREKTSGRWNKLLCVRPRIKGTALAHAVNLRDPSLYRGVYYGSWLHNEQGSIGNGTNTYMTTGLSPIEAGCTQSSAGMSFAWTNTATDEYRSVMGYYFGNSNRFSFYVQNGSGSGSGDMIPCLFDYSTSKKYTRAAGGILTISRVGTTVNGVLNGVAQPDLTGFGGTMVNEPIAEGANYWGVTAGSPFSNYHKGNIGLTALHMGFTNAESIAFANSILQFETDLNRANNW